MKNIIAAVIAIVCILAGGVGGYFVKSMTAGGSAAAKPADGAEKDGHGEKKDDHAKKPEKAGGHGKEAKDSHGKEKGGHGEEAGAEGASVYYKFSREFIVPIIHEGKVDSLVILNLNLEADSSVEQKLFEMEPKLRDNIMTTLITLSNDGQTFESMTSVENYETIRSMVLMNLQTVLSSGIKNVLIVDLAKQDV